MRRTSVSLTVLVDCQLWIVKPRVAMMIAKQSRSDKGCQRYNFPPRRGCACVCERTACALRVQRGCEFHFRLHARPHLPPFWFLDKGLLKSKTATR